MWSNMLNIKSVLRNTLIILREFNLNNFFAIIGVFKKSTYSASDIVNAG